SNKIRNNVWADFYNSAISVSKNQITDYYHKSKLVVGAETLPYNEILMPVIGEFMIDLGGTVSSRVTQKKPIYI
ncbi:MAG: apolipoprotein N-acyltransferase, partial [Flavobacteriaceae bacterium]|nr:apolipoprotein N-acyltransferase [Flavobacteriaceae bacterium]